MTSFADLRLTKSQEWLDQWNGAMDRMTAISRVPAAYLATSASEMEVSAGAKSLTLVESGRAFAAGDAIVAWRTSLGLAAATFVVGIVTSYDDGTDALAFTVAAGDTGGSGTHTDWSVSVLRLKGEAGDPLDYAALTEGGSLADDDLLAFRDTDAAAVRKITVANLKAALAGDTVLSWRSVTAATALAVADADFVIGAAGTFTITVAPSALGSAWNGRVRNVGDGIITLGAGSGGTAAAPLIGTASALDLHAGEAVLLVLNGTTIEVGGHDRNPVVVLDRATATTAVPLAAFDIAGAPAGSTVVIRIDGLQVNSASYPALYIATAASTAVPFNSADYRGFGIKAGSASSNAAAYGLGNDNFLIFDQPFAAGTALTFANAEISISNWAGSASDVVIDAFWNVGSISAGTGQTLHARGVFNGPAHRARVGFRPTDPASYTRARFHGEYREDPA